MNCHDAILKEHEKFSLAKNAIQAREWLGKFMVRLTSKPIESQESKKNMQECLLLLVNLFFVETPDRFHLHGKPLKNLSSAERDKVRELLTACV